MRPLVSQRLQGGNFSPVIRRLKWGLTPPVSTELPLQGYPYQRECEAASHVEITKEKRKAGFTTFGPLSQIKEIKGRRCRLWRGERI